QLYPVTVPIEELDAELFFQLADLVAHRRLRFPQPLRGATDPAAVDDGHEGLEPDQIELHDDLKIRWSPSKIHSFLDEATRLICVLRSNEIRTLSSRYSALS